MSEEPFAPNRGFHLIHQKVVLDIDFSGALRGTAYLTIRPTHVALRTIYLNASPLLDISAVTLSSPTEKDPLLPTPATYALCDTFQPMPMREPPVDITSHPEIKRKTWAATGEADQGELAISCTGGWIRIVQTDTHQELAPIDIRVDYSLTLGGKITEGIVFERDNVPHMFLSPTTYDAARIWTPCVDNLWERSTWEFEFIVPSYLEGGEDVPVMVVSSGELQEQVTHPNNPHKTIFHYLQTNPCSVQQISFAAGPFEVETIVPGQRPILGFCLPGDTDLMLNSTDFMSRAMSFYTSEFGTYPLSDFKLVFVNGARSECSSAATIAIVSSDLLYPPEVIDQAITTREVLSLALIQQWVGINIIPKTVSDTWLINGLALYLRGLFLRHLLGNNEYRYRLKKDIDKCAKLDQGDYWPLCVPGALELHDVSFINLKAPLVLHILDRNLVKAGTSVGLTRVIPRIFLNAFSDDLPGNMLSTSLFFRTCRKVAGIDLQLFQDQWVYGSGCPHFNLRTNFIRKKFLVELTVNQTHPAALSTGKPEKRAVPLFDGSLAVRIHEADGAPFEHLVDIKTASKTFNLPFNTKYKRTRRSGHIAARFRNLREDLAADNAEPDADEARLRDVDRAEVFAYPPWDDEAERERWKVSEWSDEEVEAMMGEGGGYEWIRIDPECEWIASFDFSEKPWYWISQLQGDRDVIAQIQAIQHMVNYQSPVVANELARTVLVKNYFYRVRMEAAKELFRFNTTDCDYIGHFLLVKLYQALFCTRQGADELLPKPNDFSSLAEYMVQKAIVSAMADLRDPSTRNTWKDVRRLLLDILKFSDNTSNQFDDSMFKATILSAIGNAFSLPSWQPDENDRAMFEEAIQALDRAVTMDRLVPSFHNSVTVAGLLTHAKLVLGGRRFNDSRTFLSYTREGNYEGVRLAAFDCLLLCKPPGRSVAVFDYLIKVIRTDPSLTVRRHVARSLSESIVMSLALGDIKPRGDFQSGIVEMNGDHVREQSNDKADRALVEAIRNEYASRDDIKGRIREVLVGEFAGLDRNMRLALLKLSEVIATSVKERPPGPTLVIHTPIVETPAVSTPRIRLSLGGQTQDANSEDYFSRAVALNPAAPIQPPKKKKDKPVQKSQRTGLPDADLKAIQNALQKLYGHKASYIFLHPVDPIRDNAPDYPVVIKRPMDLMTINARIDNGHYSSRQEFVDDVRLIVNNCYTFNGRDSHIGKIAADFESYFDKLWSKIEATLSAASKVSTSASAPLPLPSRFVEQTAIPSASVRRNPIKFTIAPSKPAEAPKTPIVPPMAPPPVPPKKRASIAESPPVKVEKPVASALSSGTSSNFKPRPSASSNEVDDLLGEEVDAIGAAQSQPKKPTFWAMPKAEEPKAKKPKVISRLSPEKVTAKSSPGTTSSGRTPPIAAAPLVPNVKLTPPPPAPAPLYNLTRAKPPPNLPPTSSNPMPFRTRRAKVVLAALKKLPEAIIFLRPVDPVADGCPTYLEEISEPMDLGTIAKKMELKQYPTMGAFAYDVELVVANCWQFNPPGPITACADFVEKVFWQEWPKAVNPNMTPEEKKVVSGILSRSLKEAVGLLFREPVDPVALNIPQYFEIIPPEEARDLSLIKSKLDKGQYSSVDEVNTDIELMLDNARMFNGPGYVTDEANKFAEWWAAQRAKADV